MESIERRIVGAGPYLRRLNSTLVMSLGQRFESARRLSFSSRFAGKTREHNRGPDESLAQLTATHSATRRHKHPQIRYVFLLVGLDGPFRTGSTGEVKLRGQPSRKLLITYCEPLEGYTDRYFLPFYGKMDWHHTIKETGGGREVTFRIEVSGPAALILAPIMRNMLRDGLPPSVDKLVSLAEEA